jgi:hypothetical protein
MEGFKHVAVIAVKRGKSYKETWEFWSPNDIQMKGQFWHKNIFITEWILEYKIHYSPQLFPRINEISCRVACPKKALSKNNSWI